MEIEIVPAPVTDPKPAQKRAKKKYDQTPAGRVHIRKQSRKWKDTPGGKALKKRGERGRRDRRWLEREFVAWDGEGVTRDDNSHDYIILANSRGDVLRDMKNLTTSRIFDFLLRTVDRETINVIYGAGYDWNKWLSSLTEEELDELYHTGTLDWHGYRLQWRQGKTFHIMKDGESALFYDVVSFFQTAFVNACDSYLGDQFEHRDLIVENKMLRSSFRAADLDEIARYNSAELVNLVKLMNELRLRLHKVGLKPARWDGPGAIAVALMGREKIPAHLEQAPEEISSAIRHAYFGGRFEVVKCGHVERTAYEYDINSAYPWALLDVPSLAGGRWVYHDSDPGPLPYALYHISYRSGTATTFPQPLPCRYKKGFTAYPQSVTGWYWSPEYDVTRQYVDMYGGSMEILGAWEFIPATDVKPFAYVADLFTQRRKLKAAGDGAHVGIKLGLNSQYGKLAQQVGWRRDPRTGELRIPPYHQLDWAGYVTSKCRAAVLGVALPHLDRVIAWETDAMFCEVPLDVPMGDGLGEWEYTEFSDLTYLQSGMYFANAWNPKQRVWEKVAKTRGVDKGSLTREDVLTALQNGDSHVPSQLTRFVGIGIALAQDFKKWGQWFTSPKNIALAPDGKRTHIGCNICQAGTFSLGEWHSTILAPWAHNEHSAEYEIEWVNPGEMSEGLSALRQGHYEGGGFDD